MFLQSLKESTTTGRHSAEQKTEAEKLDMFSHEAGSVSDSENDDDGEKSGDE